MTEKRKAGRPKKNKGITPNNNSNDTNINNNNNSTQSSSENNNSNKNDFFNEDIMNDNQNSNNNSSSNMNDDNHNYNMGSNSNTNSNSKNDIDEELMKGMDFSNDKGFNDIPNDEPDILGESTVKRSYATDGSNGGAYNGNSSTVNSANEERIIPEPVQTNQNSSVNIDPDAAKNLGLNPNDIPMGDGQNPSGFGGANGSQGSSYSQPSNSNPSESNLKDLSPNEKREAVEKTAEAIVELYANYFPLPFIHFASHNVKKLRKMEKDGLIDLDQAVKRDGTTAKDWFNAHNEKVQEAFIVTEKTKESIKEPLIDVLMEKDIAMTPTQRLLLAVGQHLVGSVMLTAQFMGQKKEDIETMKEMHEEKMAMMKEQMKRDEEIQTARKRAEAEAIRKIQEEEERKYNEEQRRKRNEEKEEDREEGNSTTQNNIINEAEGSEETSHPSMEDALNNDNNNDLPE